MKRYTNYASELRSVHFDDGSTQFLFRGQSFETNKTPSRIDDGIRIKDVTKPTAKKTTVKDTE